jgi:hypothetical protein
MEISILVNGSKDRGKERENSFGLTVAFMMGTRNIRLLVFGRMVRDVAWVD